MATKLVACSVLVEHLRECPTGQMNGLELFAKLLGIDVKTGYFKPEVVDHEGDRFWQVLIPFS